MVSFRGGNKGEMDVNFEDLALAQSVVAAFARALRPKNISIGSECFSGGRDVNFFQLSEYAWPPQSEVIFLPIFTPR